ncbi:MAG: SDR family NAD(P)-dependent oxidoreductase [Thermodesulfobacteriota bacterium]|jgi:NAD(P)-dependent dehydrogenase (short-subunit alcohol dehydrogenase family)
MRLKDKIAVITGSSRGIGRAIAERLAREGVLVAIHYGRNAEGAADTVRTIEGANGHAFAIQADLAVPEQIRQLFDQLDTALRQRTGGNRFDILVNNAAAPGWVTGQYIEASGGYGLVEVLR